MKTWKLANRRSIRLFEFNQNIVAITIGKKPRHCAGPQLTVLNSGRLVLHCECAEECTQLSDREDDYFIVCPLAGLRKTREIEVLHEAGCDLLHLEPLSGERSAPLSQSSVLGISQDFSLEAAFKDALAKLNPKTSQTPGLIEVVSMGALYGGFSGFSRLFVRVEKTEARLFNATPGGDQNRK